MKQKSPFHWEKSPANQREHWEQFWEDGDQHLLPWETPCCPVDQSPSLVLPCYCGSVAFRMELGCTPSSRNMGRCSGTGVNMTVVRPTPNPPHCVRQSSTRALHKEMVPHPTPNTTQVTCNLRLSHFVTTCCSESFLHVHPSGQQAGVPPSRSSWSPSSIPARLLSRTRLSTCAKRGVRQTPLYLELSLNIQCPACYARYFPSLSLHCSIT